MIGHCEKKWLNFLASRKQGILFLQAFKPTANVKLTCHQLNFKLQSGVPESDILPQVTKLWVVGKSQDKACDPLFERWKKKLDIKQMNVFGSV